MSGWAKNIFLSDGQLRGKVGGERKGRRKREKEKEQYFTPLQRTSHSNSLLQEDLKIYWNNQTHPGP